MRGSTLDSAWKRGCRGREGLVRIRAVFSIEDICKFLSLVLPSQESEQLTNLMLSFSSVDCGEMFSFIFMVFQPPLAITVRMVSPLNPLSSLSSVMPLPALAIPSVW